MKIAAPGLETRDNGGGVPLRWPRDTLYPQKLALTSPKSGGRSVGILCLLTKAMKFSSVYTKYVKIWKEHEFAQTKWNNEKLSLN
jgi:hypothetical protein